MQKIFSQVKSIEEYACQKFNLSEDLMIENAAMSLENAVMGHLAGDGYAAGENRLASVICAATYVPKICILCGSGNNGADGYALSRRLAGEFSVAIVAVSKPKSPECVKLAEASRAVGIKIFCLYEDASVENIFLENTDVIVDCIYGTGFHGTLDDKLINLLQKANCSKGYKIACDIPSGIDKNGLIATVHGEKAIAFSADVTVTMGGYKLALFSDAAKNFTGKILYGKIGVAESLLTENFVTEFYLLEKCDIKLPLRTDQSSHKGNYGHAVIFMGEKFGAATIAATAAMNFGAGLVSLIDICDGGNTDCNSEKNALATASPSFFSPEFMYVKELPENTTAISVGSGLGCGNNFNVAIKHIKKLLDKASAKKEKNSCAGKSYGIVFDADIFYYEKFAELLAETVSKNVQIVLTPHPKEFQSLLDICLSRKLSVAEIVEKRFELVLEFSKKFPSITLVLKGAYTLISANGNIYVAGEGTPALAKGGSGDVLAGMICALLAQGYNATDAAITSVLAHGIASQKFSDSYSLTPMKLIDAVAELQSHK